MNSFFSYFSESVNELKHITWPKQDELLRLTVATIVVVLVFSGILAGIDWSFSTGYQYLLSL